VIFAVLDVSFADNLCINCSFFTFIQTMSLPKLFFCQPIISVKGFLRLVTDADLKVDLQLGFTTSSTSNLFPVKHSSIPRPAYLKSVLYTIRPSRLRANDDDNDDVSHTEL